MKRDVRNFPNSIEEESKRDDCKALLKIMDEESGYRPPCTVPSSALVATTTNMKVGVKGGKCGRLFTPGPDHCDLFHAGILGLQESTKETG